MGNKDVQSGYFFLTYGWTPEWPKTNSTTYVALFTIDKVLSLIFVFGKSRTIELFKFQYICKKPYWVRVNKDARAMGSYYFVIVGHNDNPIFEMDFTSLHKEVNLIDWIINAYINLIEVTEIKTNFSTERG